MKRQPKHQEETVGYVVPECPIHRYQGPKSLAPMGKGCVTCCEVNALYTIASSDPEQSYIKSQMLQDLVHHWVEGIKRGDFKTVDDLVQTPRLEN